VEKAFIGFQDTEFQKMMAMNFFLNNPISDWCDPYWRYLPYTSPIQ